jgi:hypothetical protein
LVPEPTDSSGIVEETVLFVLFVLFVVATGGADEVVVLGTTDGTKTP